MEVVEDTLVSLGHEFQWTRDLHAARKALAQEQYAYVLLDLEFPAKDKGLPSKENGAIFLEEIQRAKGFKSMPVIVMSGHIAYTLNRSNEMRDQGSWAFITKPFPTESHTLACVIRKVLKDKARQARKGEPNRLQAFAGGELVFRDDRVELEGVKIISDRGAGLTISVLRALRRTRDEGLCAMSAGELATAVEAPDETTITGCIRTLRHNITVRLKRLRNLEVGAGDVILRDEQGYRLRNWISVREDLEPASISQYVPAETSPMSLQNPMDVPGGTSLMSLGNDRQQWILEQARQGELITRPMLERRFGISDKTAKRDLSELTRRNQLEYVRVGREGHYRCVWNAAKLDSERQSDCN